jgi:hypothetical protein
LAWRKAIALITCGDTPPGWLNTTDSLLSLADLLTLLAWRKAIALITCGDTPPGWLNTTDSLLLLASLLTLLTSHPPPDWLNTTDSLLSLADLLTLLAWQKAIALIIWKTRLLATPSSIPPGLDSSSSDKKNILRYIRKKTYELENIKHPSPFLLDWTPTQLTKRETFQNILEKN